MLTSIDAPRVQAGNCARDPQAAAVLLHEMVVSEPVYLATMGQPLSPAAVQAHVRQAVAVFLAGTRAG